MNNNAPSAGRAIAGFFDRYRTSPGVWSLADQGVVSLGNFLTNIFLARFLIPADYGIFALIYGLIIVLNSFHSCVIGYPLSVKGAAADVEGLKQHTRSALVLTLLLSLPFGGIVIGASIALGRPGIALECACALLCWELQETLRRSLMAHLRHGDAIWGDGFSYVGQAALIFLCMLFRHISLQEVFGIIAATSVCAAAMQAIQLRLRLNGSKGSPWPVREFWIVGRWAVFANAAVSISTVAFPWVLALRSVQDSASFQALLNVVGVANPIMLGVSNLIVPATTRTSRSSGIQSAWRTSARYGLGGIAVLLPYYLMLLLYPTRILRIFYGAHSPYLALATPLCLLVIGYALVYVAHVLSAFFYGLERGQTVLYAQIFGGVAAVLVGLPLARIWGVLGACGGLTLGYGVQAAAFVGYLVRARSHMSEVTFDCQQLPL